MTESMKEWAKEALAGRMGETDDEDDQHTCFALEVDTKYNAFLFATFYVPSMQRLWD